MLPDPAIRYLRTFLLAGQSLAARKMTDKDSGRLACQDLKILRVFCLALAGMFTPTDLWTVSGPLVITVLSDLRFEAKTAVLSDLCLEAKIAVHLPVIRTKIAVRIPILRTKISVRLPVIRTKIAVRLDDRDAVPGVVPGVRVPTPMAFKAYLDVPNDSSQVLCEIRTARFRVKQYNTNSS